MESLCIGTIIGLAIVVVVLMAMLEAARRNGNHYRNAYNYQASASRRVREQSEATVTALRERIRRDCTWYGTLVRRWQGIRAASDPCAGHPGACECRWCMLDEAITLVSSRERGVCREAEHLYNQANRGNRG